MFFKKFIIGVLFVCGMSGNLMSDEMYSASSCGYFSYHDFKNEFNLDEPNNSLLENYSAELFTANHIYSIDKVRDIDEEFQFGVTNKAKLIKYTNDDVSGFTAGVYLINNEEIVIVFGGTKANEEYSNESDFWPDFRTDLRLLSNIGEDRQISQTRTFMQESLALANNKTIDVSKISISGHSLGGGLAQYANMFTGIRAVTFNTAMNPLTVVSKTYLQDNSGNFLYDGSNITNFMTNKDWLTPISILLEAKSIVLDNNHVEFILPTVMEGVFADTGKLIWGSRHTLMTDTGHGIADLIKYIYPNYGNYSNFENAKFVDILENSSLSCSVVGLLKNHSISYPSAEREYKFYPDVDVTANEVAIFLVNTFLYEEFRTKELENNNLTRFEYLSLEFPYSSEKTLSSTITVQELNDILTKIFIYRTDQYIADRWSSLKLTEVFSRNTVRKVLLKNWSNHGIGKAQIKDLDEMPNTILKRKDVAVKVLKTSDKDWAKLVDKQVDYYTATLGAFVMDGIKLIIYSNPTKEK